MLSKGGFQPAQTLASSLLTGDGWVLFYFILFYFILFLVCFLGPHLQHTEVPGLQVESELQLPAYNTFSNSGSELHQ